MILRALIVAIVIIVLSACSLMDVAHRYDPQHDFSGYKSYTWLSEDPSSTEKITITDQDADKLIRTQISHNLNNRGFTKTTAETADFFVHYQAMLYMKSDREYHTQWIDFNQLYRATNVKYTSSTQTRLEDTYSYESGRLIIDIIDAVNRQLVWRGILETPVGVHKEEEKRINRLKTAVDKVIQAFPPKKK